uniref:Thymidylate kinase n=1 Tax=Strigamia maritima TaxID=126957 RepID=T1JGQ2_STRMM
MNGRCFAATSLLVPRFFSAATSTMSSTKRGALIVLEGCDRSGKSSQANKLVEKFNLEGTACNHLRFPDRTTTIGTLINDYLQQKSQIEDHVIHLLFSANRWEFAQTIKSKLKKGINIIIDRYAYSGVAFSAAKQGMDINWCKQSDVGLPRPDLVLFLDISPERAAERSGYGDEIYESLELQNKVYANYLKLKERNWKLVNADRKFDEVHAELVGHIHNAINSIKDTHITGLWKPNHKS